MEPREKPREKENDPAFYANEGLIRYAPWLLRKRQLSDAPQLQISLPNNNNGATMKTKQREASRNNRWRHFEFGYRPGHPVHFNTHLIHFDLIGQYRMASWNSLLIIELLIWQLGIGGALWRQRQRQRQRAEVVPPGGG